MSNGQAQGDGRMPPEVFARLTDEQKLAIFEAAALALASGQTRTQVRHSEYWVSYGLGSISYLKGEIARLRAITGRRHGFTVGPQPVAGTGQRNWR